MRWLGLSLIAACTWSYRPLPHWLQPPDSSDCAAGAEVPALLRVERSSATGGLGYAIVVYEDGSYVYVGDHGVSRSGVERGRVSRAALNDLGRLYAGFEAMPERQPRYRYDGESIVICWKNAGVAHTRVATPESTPALRRLIDESARAIGISAWIARPSSREVD